jgi:hypothetical protein
MELVLEHLMKISFGQRSKKNLKLRLLRELKEKLLPRRNDYVYNLI